MKIIYCVPCGYITRATWLKEDLEKNIKNVKVTLQGGDKVSLMFMPTKS